jgi:hypothetical protein
MEPRKKDETDGSRLAGHSPEPRKHERDGRVLRGWRVISSGFVSFVAFYLGFGQASGG